MDGLLKSLLGALIEFAAELVVSGVLRLRRKPPNR